jgi:hypothetical protein
MVISCPAPGASRRENGPIIYNLAGIVKEDLHSLGQLRFGIGKSRLANNAQWFSSAPISARLDVTSCSLLINLPY